MQQTSNAIESKEYNVMQQVIVDNALAKLIKNATPSQLKKLADLSDNPKALPWLEKNGEKYMKFL